MIKSITGGSGITVMGGMPTTTYISPGAQSAGMLRYNPNSSNIEVYDGIAWLTLSTGYANIELSADVQAILHWAREKMHREKMLKSLAERSPAVADALAAVEHAQEQLDIVATLADV
jgi:hypothetical protein